MTVKIIAEIGNTHEGSLGLAKRFIKIAADCGVDVVKIQTHLFEEESLPNAPNPPYFQDETRKEYFERTSFSLQQHISLAEYCREVNVEFMSSPFSEAAVDLLEEVGVTTYKVASGEVTNLPLLKKIAATGKQVLLSSGMSNWVELDVAFDTLKKNGAGSITVMQCTSEYPCSPESVGLNMIELLKERYRSNIGFSDHTLGLYASLAAVCKGATVIEKHFTLSKDMYGSDAMNSTEPQEFKMMVSEIRDLKKALSSPVEKNQKASTLLGMKLTFEKSIVSREDLTKGNILDMNMVTMKKPGDGLPASKLDEVIGKRLSVDVALNTQLSLKHFV